MRGLAMTRTPLEWKRYYDAKAFREKWTYEGELGPSCGKKGTRLRLWSPVSTSCTLRLYPDGEKDTRPVREEPMRKEAHGVFSYHTKENLSGMYYDFVLTRDGETIVCGDPYAVACGANSGRCELVDLSTTDPEGWKSDVAPALQTENVIWETHVKDFSFDKSGGFPEKVRGKFKAFTVHGTTLQGRSGQVPTGLDYLKSLGITHVQLMPVFDYASVDETAKDPEKEYNWGYDPVYYNVPEGSYSSDPHHGEVRIRELKEAILAMHRAGLRVNMDVVYNHTYDLNTAMQQSMPYYFYRVTKEGELSNGSGCGNDVASEREMVAKFILDSVLYWAREYHFDGFRFDLMGLLPVRLMNRIQRELDRIYGPGEKMVYGEPWAAGPSSTSTRVKLASKENFKGMHRAVAMFCDDTRNMIAGSPFEEDDHGIVCRSVSCEVYCRALDGWKNEPDLPISSPAQVISYASCHDNYTLYDNLARGIKNKEQLREGCRLAACVYLTCPGIAFLLSGEEFLRTKGGDGNSYRSPIAVNSLKWESLVENKESVTLYKELFRLRKLSPAFFGKGSRSRVLSKEVSDTSLFVQLDNSLEKKDLPQGFWRHHDAAQLQEARKTAQQFPVLFLAVNVGESPVTGTMPEGDWTLLFANGREKTSFVQNPERAARMQGLERLPVEPMGFYVFGRA